jgi:hypothetical protein
VSTPVTPPEVCSFDIFDTLVARRCVSPHSIFDAVEKKSGLKSFAEVRRHVEAVLYGAGDYTLDDIYRRMVADCGLTDQASVILKALELEAEFSTLIPIAEHIAEVRPGDLLVSDMYLPKSFIMRVVREKCGLYFNPLYLSSHGKSSGKAWDLLSRQFHIRQHTGDNHHSDVVMSQQRGIPSRHTTVSAVTAEEQTIESMGYQGLAHAMREARLAYRHADPELLWIGRAQIEVNFPLLVLLALRLLAMSRASGYQNVLFSARDCYLLFLVFRRLADRLGDAPHSEYFLTSRIARAAPSPAYLSYLNSLSSGGKTLIVDLCGTGWSLTRLLEVAGRPDIDIFLMQYLANSHLMQQYRGLCEITWAVNPQFVTTQGQNEILEALNTASHEMVVDVVQAGDAYVPKYLQQQPDPRFSELLASGERAIALALECTERIDLTELRRYVDTVGNADIENCYRAFHNAARLVPGIARRQLSENQHLATMLQARSPQAGAEISPIAAP